MTIRSLFLILLTATLPLSGQVVTTDPVFPRHDQPVTILFHAAEGNGGLAGFTGDIWAHTGVLTDRSSSPGDWRYVVAGWSENTEKAKLRSVGTDLWELEIGPSIREFYGVPESETIEQLAFVFRNSNGSVTGRAADGGDIFTQVYQEGLFVSFTQPADDFQVLDPGLILYVTAEATFADSLLLLLDDTMIARSETRELITNMQVPDAGIHEVVVRAWAQGESAEDRFSFMVRGSEVIEELPAGLRQGANYLDEQSVTLVLFAPEKELVFLIGDFNNWQTDTGYLMKKTPDGSFFWLTVSDLEPGKEYAYQYFIDGTVRIADPYTHKVLDPWNDPWIEDEVYPGLIPYPAGMTTQIVSVLQTNRQPYDWQHNEFVLPENEEMVIYELLIRDFMEDHTFSGLIDTLDYLSRLGVNTIELMPVNEFEGNDSWGYNPSFYFAVDKYYGPDHTFKAFVDSAHGRGMAVVMDMVLNHSFGQSPMVRMYWDSANDRPAPNNPWYNTVSPNPVFSWGYDFNHDSEATRAFVDSVNHFWLSEYRIDGFRFDFTKGFTNTPGDGGAYDASRIAILKRMADRIWEVNPEARIILEHFADNREETELANYGMLIWGNMSHAYGVAAKGYLAGGASDLAWADYRERGWDHPNLVAYMESHDEERMMYKVLTEGNNQNLLHNVREQEFALKRMEVAANFFLPLPGPRMIWMFGELGYDYSINYNDRVGRKPIRWDYYDEHMRQRLYQVYGALAHLKTRYPVFSTRDYELVVRDTVKRIHLNHPDMNVTILGNFSTWSKKGQGGFQHTGWWYDFWTGDSLFVDNTEAWMDFAPSEYRLYTDIRLDPPDILSGLLFEPAYTRAEVRIFPNPAAEQLTLEMPVTHHPKTIRITDLHGRVVMEQNGAGRHLTHQTLDVSRLERGVYVIHVFCQSYNWQGKLILAGK